MKESTVKFPLSLQQEFLNFKDYSNILEDAISLFNDGKYHHIKTMAFVLRVFVCSKKSLLLRIEEKFKVQGQIKFDGMTGIPDSNPLSKDRFMSTEEYLNSYTALVQTKITTEEGQIIDAPKEFTVREFVWEYASKLASHSDDTLPQEFYDTSLHIGGLPAQDRSMFIVAKNLLSLSKTLISHIEKRYV